MTNLFAFLVLCFAFGVLLVGGLALIKRKDEVSWRFLFFSAVVFGWGALQAFWFTQSYSRDVSLLLMRASIAFAIWIPITWFHFVLSFTGRREPWKYFTAANYLLAFGLTAISQSPYFIEGTSSILHFHDYISPGIFFHFFTGYFCVLVPLAFFYLVREYWLNPVRRGQLRCVIIAMIFGFAAGSSTFLPIYKMEVPLYPMFFMAVYPFFMGIALIRYGLFDARQIADAFQREKMTALGILAASLNHEIRNPLFIAQGRIETYLDAAGRGDYPTLEEKHAKAEGVLNSAAVQLHRVMDTFQRFSDFAKPFNMRNEKQTVSFTAVMAGVRELVNHALQEPPIEVIEKVSPDIQVLCHRRQLEEILVNLIMNACQAIKLGHEDGSWTEKESGKIEIRAHQTRKTVTIEIKDNGSGMNEEQVHRIFEPFYTTKEKGTGLGLYITKQLVEKNGGKISVKSKLGLGTSFLINISPSNGHQNRIK